MRTQNWWKKLSLLLATAITILMLLLGAMASRVPAATPENILQQPGSVSQLTDIQPSDYYYQSLESLVERYGVNVAYPDNTFRANRPMTRGEFAVFLNSALDKLGKVFVIKTSDLGSKEELVELQRMAEKLEAEIKSLRQSNEKI